MNVVIAVLSHYPDLFERFRSDVERYEPDVPKILVRDEELIECRLYPDYYPGVSWTVVDGEQPFSFPRNMNLAWHVAGKSDVVIAGDDVQFTGPFVGKLQEVAYSDPTIGFCVPETGGQSAFVCAYIKRKLLDEVGEMDEAFDCYGFCDNDFYRRFEAKGWRTQPTNEVSIIHQGATSFYRKAAAGGESVQDSCDRGQKIYEEKWAK